MMVGKNAIFQDLYTNIMILSHEQYHLSKVTVSSRNSTFNKFNGFLDQYIEI